MGGYLKSWILWPLGWAAQPSGHKIHDLRSFGVILGSSLGGGPSGGVILGGHFGVFGPPFWAFLRLLGPFWAFLGPFWGFARSHMGVFGPHFWAFLGFLGLFGPFLDPFGPFWGVFLGGIFTKYSTFWVVLVSDLGLRGGLEAFLGLFLS